MNTWTVLGFAALCVAWLYVLVPGVERLARMARRPRPRRVGVRAASSPTTAANPRAPHLLWERIVTGQRARWDDDLETHIKDRLAH